METKSRCCRRVGAGNVFAIAREEIDVAAVEEVVRSPECGAIVTFVGAVRGQSDDGLPVAGLEYEAHEPLAIEAFEHIAREARARWGELRVAVVHRAGVLDVGDVAVVVAVAAPHRSEAFSACAFAIDELKQRAPIWKKERYREGLADRWRENP